MKRKVLSLLAVLMVLSLAGCGSSKAKERVEYIDNLKLVQITMLQGAATAEGVCNLTKKVWYNTIYKKSDIETDPYTRNIDLETFDADDWLKNRGFNSDFNTSLEKLYNAPSMIEDIESIKQNREEVAELIKKLQYPPEDLTSCYSTMDSMYDTYQDFTALAISPSGNLNTYSENFSAYDSTFMKYYDKLSAQLPDE